MRDLVVAASPKWLEAWAAAHVGVLVMSGVSNPDSNPALDAALEAAAAALRERHAGHARTDLLAKPELAAYAAYYRGFDKTYHVLLQLESVALKGKPMRARGALVGAMFKAELEDGLLTAGHDADLVEGHLTIDVTTAADTYTGIGGREIDCAPGDMCIRDADGILSSIVYGPDDRTKMTAETSRALFTTYAPDGVSAAQVRAHLEAIAANVRLFAPNASIDALRIVPESDDAG